MRLSFAKVLVSNKRTRLRLNSANRSALLLYITINAILVSFIMPNEGVPQALAESMLGNGLGMVAFLLVVIYWLGLSLWLPRAMGVI